MKGLNYLLYLYLCSKITPINEEFTATHVLKKCVLLSVMASQLQEAKPHKLDKSLIKCRQMLLNLWMASVSHTVTKKIASNSTLLSRGLLKEPAL